MADLKLFRSQHPDVFVLDWNAPQSLDAYLRARDWLRPNETVLSATRAGDGNMNYTARVRTTQRTLIVKQSRPWVEKYDFLEAPWDRARTEGIFYRTIESQPGVQARMPALLGLDENSRILALKDLGEAGDFTGIYAGEALSTPEVDELAAFLSALHAVVPSDKSQPILRNQAMRELNHAHIFDIPLRRENGLDLEAVTPGLAAAADSLKSDLAFVARTAELGIRYLSNPASGALLHGDFFPGSFLRTTAGIRIIDPEFCYLGDPEFDWSVLLAHAILAQQSPELIAKIHQHALGSRAGFDEALLLSFAGVEIMRRLIGYAQIARLKIDLTVKRALLDRARLLVLEPSRAAREMTP